MEPRSVLDCVHFFFVCTIGRRLLRRFLRIMNCHEPLIFAIYFGGGFGKCIGGSNTPAIWNHLWTSGLEFQILQGI